MKRKSFSQMATITLVAWCFSVCISVASCDSSEVKSALAESIKQMVGDEAKINYDSFEKIPLEDYAIKYKGVNQNTTFTCETETTINLRNELIFRDIIEYAPQYDYDNKIYVKIIEPREIFSSRLSNMGYQIAFIRSDLSSAQKAIVAKIYADEINAKSPKAPNPNKSPQNQTKTEYIEWGQWIMEVAGLNKKKYKAIGNGIYPIDKMNMTMCYCYDKVKGNKFKEIPLLWINTKTGNLHFNPSKLNGIFIKEYAEVNDFCGALRESYKGTINEAFKAEKDKIIPLKTDTIKENDG